MNKIRLGTLMMSTLLQCLFVGSGREGQTTFGRPRMILFDGGVDVCDGVGIVGGQNGFGVGENWR